MIRLPEDASHEVIDQAIQLAKTYARQRGCKDLYFEPRTECIARDWQTSRMHLCANIDGKDVVLLVGPLIKHSRKLP